MYALYPNPKLCFLLYPIPSATANLNKARKLCLSVQVLEGTGVKLRTTTDVQAEGSKRFLGLPHEARRQMDVGRSGGQVQER